MNSGNVSPKGGFRLFTARKMLFSKIESKHLRPMLDAYWSGDCLVFSHLCMPLLERLCREFVKNGGGNVLRPNNLEGFDFKSLNRVLEENREILIALMIHMFQTLTCTSR